MGKLIEACYKIGRLFELSFLQTPFNLSASISTFIVSSSLCHSRLGYASLPCVQLLESHGHLGFHIFKIL
jgi:hypothetical protein